jgi:hypothetical protein
MGAFKDKIVKELLKNKQYDLADMIDTIESDVDVANYISSNRGYFTKAYTTPDLELMPEFRKALYSELKTGNVDYDKEFGKDWYKDYGNIPADQIKFVADKQGKDFKSLAKEMQDEAIRRNRYDIAHEGVLGTVMPFVTPRIQEAVERGESPSAADVTIDLGETAVQAVPWGRASMVAVNNPIVRRLVGGAISNTTAPLLAEVADAAAYDSTNARGNFDPVDVAAGAGVNALGANLLKGVGGRAASVVGAKDAGQKLMNLGEGISQREAKANLANAVKQLKNADNKNITDIINKYVKGEPLTRREEDILRKLNTDRMLGLEYAVNPQKVVDTEAAVKKRIKDAESTIMLEDQYKQYLRNKELLGSPDLESRARNALLNDPALEPYKYSDTDFGNLPTESSLMKQEAVKNLITNKLGGWMDEQGKALTRIPVAGPMIQQRLDEREKEEAERAARDSLINYILTKYGEPRGL